MPWNPTEYQRFEASLNTSVQTCRIVTDAGKAFIKTMGNRQGPHVLACELVAGYLARWLGLRTFDFAVLNVQPTDEIPIAAGKRADAGPAFVTRAERGNTWGGDSNELQVVQNKADIAGMVVFDTWTRNCDRCPPPGTGRRPNYDNVFISREGTPQVVVMDHSHCFTCNRELTTSVSAIANVQDPLVYGLFDGFRPFMRKEHVEGFAKRLNSFGADIARGIVRRIPEEWQVTAPGQAALAEFIALRASFVAGSIVDALQPLCWPTA